MYFPYLHGMQKEMLALRQSITLLASEACVQPVIEPVRHVLASLRHTLQACESEGLTAWMVVNPMLQEFAGVGAAPALSWGRHLLASVSSPRRYLCPTLLLHAGVTPDVVRLFAQSYAGQVVGVVMAEEPQALMHLYEALQGVQVARVFLKHGPCSSALREALAPAQVVWVEPLDANMPEALKRVGMGGFLQERRFFTDAVSRFKDVGGAGFSDYTSLPSLPYPGGGPTGCFHLAFHQMGGPMDQALCLEFFVAERQFPPQRLAEARFIRALQLFHLALDRRDACFGPTEAVRRFVGCHIRGVPPTQAIARQWQLMHHLELVSGLLSGRFPPHSGAPAPR
ncbi:sce7725 family protein [Roseateles sp. SL47]|jgi:hypothetical protein|uniref:sce7725 family protein n=1 Tax=Roseateles sp. SL47 TaxID=2995138 RepID=UPI0022718E62|nr:sce7725 family protein [Roseateles sp. SL47]WAC74726.1 sce7725 family protein [Roseateles sp. SL47]